MGTSARTSVKLKTLVAIRHVLHRRHVLSVTILCSDALTLAPVVDSVRMGAMMSVRVSRVLVVIRIQILTSSNARKTNCTYFITYLKFCFLLILLKQLEGNE